AHRVTNAAWPDWNGSVVPDVSASHPVSGMPATPARPVMTASARIARRSNPSRVPVRSIVMADMDFLSSMVADRSGADAATSDDGGSGPGMRESRETAHAEVLGVCEGECDDGERDRRDHAEFGQRQPPGDERDSDEDRERDVTGEPTDTDAPHVG